MKHCVNVIFGVIVCVNVSVIIRPERQSPTHTRRNSPNQEITKTGNRLGKQTYPKNQKKIRESEMARVIQIG